MGVKLLFLDQVELAPEDKWLKEVKETQKLLIMPKEQLLKQKHKMHLKV